MSEDALEVKDEEAPVDSGLEKDNDGGGEVTDTPESGELLLDALRGGAEAVEGSVGGKETVADVVAESSFVVTFALCCCCFSTLDVMMFRMTLPGGCHNTTSIFGCVLWKRMRVVWKRENLMFYNY